MFEVIENVDFATDGFCGYNLVRLWHASCPIDLSLVIYLYFNLYSIIFRSDLSLKCAIWCNLVDLHRLVAGAGVFRLFEGHFYFENLKIVLFAGNCMCAYEQSLN